jgi:N-acetylneuraminic acid mutarotase
VKNLSALNILLLLVLTATCAFLSFPSAKAQTVGTWTNNELMPTPRLDLAVVALDGKIYAIGGRSGLNLANLNANQQYNPQTKTWTKMADLPNPQSRCVATVYNGKIYVFGSNSIQIYSPQTNQWTTKPFSPGSQWIGTANEVDGKIYLLGGGQNYNSVQMYDPTTDSLTAKTSCLQRIADHSAVVLGDKIYIMDSTFPQLTGGVPVSHSLTLIYDTSRDIWSYGASSPINVQFPAIATANVSGSPVIYLFGGSPQDFSAAIPPPASNYVQIYHPNSDSWTTGASLPTIRAHGGAAVVDNKVYVIGGAHSTTYITAMQPQLIGITNIDPTTHKGQGVWGSPVPTQCLVSVEESTNQGYVFAQQAIQTLTQSPTPILTPTPTPIATPLLTNLSAVREAESATPTATPAQKKLENSSTSAPEFPAWSVLSLAVATAVGALVFVRRRRAD